MAEYIGITSIVPLLRKGAETFWKGKEILTVVQMYSILTEEKRKWEKV